MYGTITSKSLRDCTTRVWPHATGTMKLDPISSRGLWMPWNDITKRWMSNYFERWQIVGQLLTQLWAIMWKRRSVMAGFDGHVRYLGQVRKEAIASINEKLSTCEHMWSGQEAMFSTSFPFAQHIICKFPDSYPRSHVPASYKAPWASWKDLLAPIIADVVGNLGLGAYETSKVMFTRLNAGGKIDTHIDENPSSRIPHKIHVLF